MTGVDWVREGQPEIFFKFGPNWSSFIYYDLLAEHTNYINNFASPGIQSSVHWCRCKVTDQ